MIHTSQFFNMGSTGSGGGGNLPPITSGLFWQFDASENTNIYYDYANSTKATNGQTVDGFVATNDASRVLTQTTALYRPTWFSNGQNSKGYLLFDGSDDGLIMPWENVFDSKYSIYMVLEPVGSNSQSSYPFVSMIGKDVNYAASVYMAYSTFGSEWEASYTDWDYDYVSNNDFTEDSVQLLTFRAQSGGNALNLTIDDGTQEDDDSNLGVDFGSGTKYVSLGSSVNGSGVPNRNMKVRIYEYLAYDNVHTNSERDQLKAYLNNKYTIYP